jgi:hypothetical protein
MKDSYEAHVTTPEQDAQLKKLREGLQEWLTKAAEGGVEHGLALTALMLFTASGAASTDIPREAVLDLMGRYYDLYKKSYKAQS